MGYYIETPAIHGKAQYLADEYGGELVPCPESYASIPGGKALIIVVDNGIFEAAGFAYSEQEFAAFTDPRDLRPKSYVLMDRTEAEILSGYNRPQGSFPDYDVKDPESVRDEAARIRAGS